MIMRRYHSARVFRERISTPTKAQETIKAKETIKDVDLIPVYTEPIRPDLIVIVSFFNPCKSIRLIQNCIYILDLLRTANIPTCVFELTSPQNNPVLKNSALAYYKHFVTTSVLFHKENLINLAVKELSSEYQKFVILDSDIIFSRKNWYNDVSDLLEKVDIAQPFDIAVWLNYNMTLSNYTLVSFCYNHVNKINQLSHPGFCWAFTLAGYEKIGGLPEEYPLGGNDTLFANLIGNTADLKVGVLSGRIFHMFHGSLRNKQYVSRHQALRRCLLKLKLTIKDCTTCRNDGIREWVSPYESTLNEVCLTYLQNRRDDDI